MSNMTFNILSLEHYSDVLEKGYVSPMVKDIMLVGLNSNRRQLGLESVDIVSNETIMETITTAGKKAWEWLLKQLKRFRDWLQGLWNSLKNLRKKVDKAESNVKSTKDASAENTFEISGKVAAIFEDVIENGALMTEDRLATFGLANNLSRKYPELVKEWNVLKATLKNKKHLARESDNISDKMNKMLFSVDIEFKNNFRIVIDPKPEVPFDFFQFTDLSDGVKEASDDSVTLKVRNRKDRLKDLNSCKAVIDNIESVNKTCQKVTDELIKDIEEIFLKAAPGTYKNKDKRKTSSIADNMKQSLDAFFNAPGLKSFFTHYTSYLNKKITLIEAETNSI